MLGFLSSKAFVQQALGAEAILLDGNKRRHGLARRVLEPQHARGRMVGIMWWALCCLFFGVSYFKIRCMAYASLLFCNPVRALARRTFTYVDQMDKTLPLAMAFDWIDFRYGERQLLHVLAWWLIAFAPTSSRLCNLTIRLCNLIIMMSAVSHGVGPEA